MKTLLSPALLAAGLLLAACTGSTPPTVRFERAYLPGLVYLTEGRVETSRWMGRRLSADEPWETLADESRTVRTQQRLSLGAADEDGVPARLEILDYEMDSGEGPLRVVLEGFVGLARFRPGERRFVDARLEGELDSTALAEAVGTAASGGGAAEGLSAAEAGEFLASTWRVLESSLADSARTLRPGEFFSDERAQQERLGSWPVRWIERSTTTLEGFDEQGRALFSIQRTLRPQASSPDSVRLGIDGEGRGRLVYDPERRTVVDYQVETRLELQLEDAAGGAWRAASSSSVELGTRFEDAR